MKTQTIRLDRDRAMKVLNGYEIICNGEKKVVGCLNVECYTEGKVDHFAGTVGVIKNSFYDRNNIKMEQTLGQKRVKAEFNPAKNGLVDQIKNKAAELIDLYETLKKEDMSHEKQRLIETASLQTEVACMLAVKSCFTD